MKQSLQDNHRVLAIVMKILPQNEDVKTSELFPEKHIVPEIIREITVHRMDECAA